jgi:hypothetical protein
MLRVVFSPDCGLVEPIETSVRPFQAQTRPLDQVKPGQLAG